MPSANRKTRPRKADVVSSEQRQRMIEEAAYFRAEHRGFAGGDPVADWLSGEQEVDDILSQDVPPDP